MFPVYHVRPVRTARYPLLYAVAHIGRWYVGSHLLPRALPWARSSWAFSPTSRMLHDILLWGQYVVQLDSSTFHNVPQYVLQRTRVFMRNVLRYERTNMRLDFNQECFGFHVAMRMGGLYRTNRSQRSPSALTMTLERQLAMFYSPQVHARFNALGES